MGSSWTRAQTRVPCIGRRILNHCATRKVPILMLSEKHLRSSHGQETSFYFAQWVTTFITATWRTNSTIRSHSMRMRISVQLVLQFLTPGFFISPLSTEPTTPPSPSNTKLHRLRHKEALSGIPNAHFTSPGWMGKQVSVIYHSPCRKRARRDL